MNKEVKKWLIKAINDYKTCSLLLNVPKEDMITDTLCFHAEQCVEKLLKAFLVHNDTDFKKVHDLEYLVKLCVDSDSEFDRLYEAARVLSDYSVDVRYPDDFYIPSLDEAREAYRIATETQAFVFAKLKFTYPSLDFP